MNVDVFFYQNMYLAFATLHANFWISVQKLHIVSHKWKVFELNGAHHRFITLRLMQST